MLCVDALLYIVVSPSVVKRQVSCNRPGLLMAETGEIAVKRVEEDRAAALAARADARRLGCRLATLISAPAARQRYERLGSQAVATLRSCVAVRGHGPGRQAIVTRCGTW